MNTNTAPPPDSLGSPSGYAKPLSRPSAAKLVEVATVTIERYERSIDYEVRYGTKERAASLRKEMEAISLAFAELKESLA